MYKDFSNYEVYEDGHIWSKKRKKFLKPSTTRDGYQTVNLYDNEGKLHFERLHKVIYFAVNGLWEYPNGMQINHKDEEKTNNHISNLELVTPKQNINWGTRNARASKTNTNHPDKSKRVGAYDKNGELVMVFPSTAEAGRQGFNQGNVAACCRGKLKHHNGFSWRYLDDDE